VLSVRRSRPSPWIWRRVTSRRPASLRELVHINLDGVRLTDTIILPESSCRDEIEANWSPPWHGAGRVWLRHDFPLSCTDSRSARRRIVLRARDVRRCQVEHSGRNRVQLTKLSVATATGDQLTAAYHGEAGWDISAQASFDASLPSGSRSCSWPDR